MARIDERPLHGVVGEQRAEPPPQPATLPQHTPAGEKLARSKPGPDRAAAWRARRGGARRTSTAAVRRGCEVPRRSCGRGCGELLGLVSPMAHHTRPENGPRYWVWSFGLHSQTGVDHRPRNKAAATATLLLTGPATLTFACAATDNPSRWPRRPEPFLRRHVTLRRRHHERPEPTGKHTTISCRTSLPTPPGTGTLAG